MAKRLQYSRWRRLPGLYRFGEKKGPDPDQDEQRLTLYLPAGLLDKAEALGRKAGAESLQHYCEQLLKKAIQKEIELDHVEAVEARRGPMEGLDAIANDPEYLAEWNVAAANVTQNRSSEARDGEPPAIDVDVTFLEPEPLPAPDRPALESAMVNVQPAAELVLRHAALASDDPTALLATLRRGEPIAPDVANELLQALVDLETALRDADRIDRRLAYALHRLAFEGQILLTDAWPTAAPDATTVDVLRMVQEGVDRILSGEDIRYYPRES